MKYNYSKIGERLKQERKNAGFKSHDALCDYIQEHNYRSFTRQTIAKWEKGIELPPLDILCTLCVPFKCEVGYLLCEYDCKYKENTDIQNVTGLSEIAIDILTHWKKIGTLPGSSYNWARNSTLAINDLIEREMWFSDDVLNPIAEYCYYRKIYELPNIPDEQRTQASNKFRLALFTATNGLTDCIQAIYKKRKST